MKSVFAILILASSLAQASVDYVAVGAALNRGKNIMAENKASVTCALNDYTQNPTCEKIEKLNDELQLLLNGGITGETAFNGCGLIGSLNQLQGSAANARDLAKDAAANDPVWSVIEKYEQSVEKYVVDLKAGYEKAKLQETYLTKCLLATDN